MEWQLQWNVKMLMFSTQSIYHPSSYIYHLISCYHVAFSFVSKEFAAFKGLKKNT